MFLSANVSILLIIVTEEAPDPFSTAFIGCRYEIFFSVTDQGIVVFQCLCQLDCSSVINPGFLQP